MKKLAIIASLLIGATSLSAQITDGEKTLKAVRADTADGWKKGGLLNINYTQVGLSNWAAGGQNSVSVVGFTNLFANLKKGESTWDNLLIGQFGVINQASAGFIKSDDRLQLTSKYGRKATKNWYYAALFDFQTQFTVGYSDPENKRGRISDFLAPGYFLGALGMDYKPSSNFTVFIAPITAKYTVVNDDQLAAVGSFGVEADELVLDTNGNIISNFDKTRLEIGGYLRMMYKRKIMENITYQTNLALFSNYANNPQNIDVNWDNILNMKVNKFISASFTTSLIYDDDITIIDQTNKGTPTGGSGPRTQFKYVLGVGFAYTFGDQ